jgi:hypothetical protein
MGGTGNDLLTTIARCPVVVECLTNRESTHPCREIVLHQWPDVPFEERVRWWRGEHHVPEPWDGHIESAPLLFLSSNPSLSSRRQAGVRSAKTQPLSHLGLHTVDDHPSLRKGVAAPKWEWTDAELVDRYSSAFDVFMTPDGTAAVDASGEALKSVQYWREMKKLADHLFGHATCPGVDYALTEVVHCKSRSEVGVANAAKECVPRYLRKTLATSPAAVIVVVGRVARQAFRHEYDYADAAQVSSPIDVEGRMRVVVFVAAPNARTPKKYPKTVAESDARGIRARLNA